MRTLRWVRRLAFAGATGCLVAAFVPSSATASTAPGIFSGHAEAAGFEFTLDTIPGQSITDPVDVRIPAGIADLSSGGNSTASAGLVYPGGGGQVPGALCLAVPAVFSAFPPPFPQPPTCDQLSKQTGQPVPPPYPLAVTVPTSDGHTTATSTLHGTTIGAGSPIVVDPVDATATATDQVAKGDATVATLNALAGTPLAVTAQDDVATTSDRLTAAGFDSRAESVLRDVEIGGVIHIGQIDSVAEVVNDGHGHVTKTAHVTIADVTAMGKGAVIDNTGISVLGQGDHGAIDQAANKALQTALRNDGIKSVHTIGAITQNLADGATVQTGGIVVTYAEQVQKPSAVPSPDQLLTETLCKVVKPACIAPPNPFSVFYGTFALGLSGVMNTAGQGPTFTIGNLAGIGTAVAGSSTGAGGQAMPGTPGTPGTPGSVGLSGGNAAGQNPAVAPAPSRNAANGSDTLSGVAHKLKLLFPAFLLAALGVLAGRLRRLPSRLPRVLSAQR